MNTHMLMTYLSSLLAQIVRREEGQTAIEYALIASLISLVIVGAVGATGTQLSSSFTHIAGAFP